MQEEKEFYHLYHHDNNAIGSKLFSFSWRLSATRNFLGFSQVVQLGSLHYREIR